MTGRHAAPRVSVVLPVLDPGPALRDALGSVVAQSIGDWEALVVDDGSAEDLAWVEAVDPRVRLLRKEHAGVSAARNAGARAATGTWVAFLDHDDRWAPAKLERQLQGLARTGAGLSHTAFTWEQEADDGTVSAWVRSYPTRLTYEAMLVGDHVCTSSVVVDRRLLLDVGGFDARLRRAEDLDLWLRLLRDGTVFDVVDDPLVTYRTHPRGASADYEDTFVRRRAVLRRHLEAARRAGDRRVAAAARAGLRRGRELAGAQAFDAARAASGGERLRHLARALAHDPRGAAAGTAPAVRARLGARPATAGPAAPGAAPAGEPVDQHADRR
jgi:glycosyltransferase involved in cell wall biosynthesis